MSRPPISQGAFEAARLAWSVVTRDDDTKVFVRLYPWAKSATLFVYAPDYGLNSTMDVRQ